MAARRRKTTRQRSTYYKRSSQRRAKRPSIDLGPRPVFTFAIWLGLAFGVGFLAYAILGTSTWSDDTLAMIPIKYALLIATGMFAVAGCLFTGLQFGWFEIKPDSPVRKTRKKSASTRRSTRRRKTTR
jgi:hypothetical protein